MPLSKHFKGHGEKVMAAMEKTYGPAKAKQVFYATENKTKGAAKKVKKRAKRKVRKKH